MTAQEFINTLEKYSIRYNVSTHRWTNGSDYVIDLRDIGRIGITWQWLVNPDEDRVTLLQRQDSHGGWRHGKKMAENFLLKLAAGKVKQM